MAIDMKKMMKKRQALKSKGAFWRPVKGGPEVTIRIVPTADGDPFKEFWVHYGLGDTRPFLSPKKSFGVDDPLHTFVRQLFSEDTESSNKMARDLMAKQRFAAPVIVRGEEELGVRIYQFGKTVYADLLDLVFNPEYGDITDVEGGTDLKIKCVQGARFPETTVTPSRHISPLCGPTCGGDERTAELLNEIPDFDNLYEKKTPEEIQVMLDAWLSGPDEEGSEDVVQYDNNGATTSVDAAFNELMNTSSRANMDA